MKNRTLQGSKFCSSLFEVSINNICRFFRSDPCPSANNLKVVYRAESHVVQINDVKSGAKDSKLKNKDGYAFGTCHLHHSLPSVII